MQHKSISVVYCGKECFWKIRKMVRVNSNYFGANSRQDPLKYFARPDPYD